MYQKKSKLPYLFLLPTILILVLFSYLPITYSMRLSFFKTVPGTGEMIFSGLDNFRSIFTDKKFFESFNNTIYYVFGATAVVVFISLIVSLILNSKIKFSSFYLTVMFIPWVLSDVVIGNTWKWLFNPDFGVLKYFFEPLGINASSLIHSPKFAMIGVILVTLWKMLAYNTLLLLAGLQNLTKDYIEAARLDGCSGIQVLRYITLPILMPTILTVTLLSIINCINQTGIVLVLTGGGPLRTTETLALYLYKEAFSNFNYSYASALSMVLAIVNILIVVFYIKISSKSSVEE